MKFIYIILAIVLFTISCTKHAGDEVEKTPAATLVISQPTTNQVSSKTDSIRITATAIASAVMHGYDVYLSKQGDTTRLQSKSIHDHNDTLVIDSRFAPLDAGNYEAHILLKLDHDGNTLHKSVSFKTE